MPFNTSDFFSTYLRQPKGQGFWMFVVQTFDGNVEFDFNGTFTAAKAACRKAFKGQDVIEVRVLG
ncbi:MAG: hypothetical protein ACHWZW_02810 [Spirulina sp.]